VYLRQSEQRETTKGKPYWLLVTHAGEEVVAWDGPVGSFAEQAVQNKIPVVLVLKGAWDSKPVVRSIRSAEARTAPLPLPELRAEDVAF
jgi:hypothetical protein